MFESWSGRHFYSTEIPQTPRWAELHYRRGAHWKQQYPPVYAEMTQVGIRLSLTTADEKYLVYGGGVRHYFIVDDLDKIFDMAKKNGIIAVPNEVEVRPWMSFTTVVDPDNHQIVFGTKNQTYYDSAREQINNIERQDSQKR